MQRTPSAILKYYKSVGRLPVSIKLLQHFERKLTFVPGQLVVPGDRFAELMDRASPRERACLVKKHLRSTSSGLLSWPFAFMQRVEHDLQQWSVLHVIRRGLAGRVSRLRFIAPFNVISFFFRFFFSILMASPSIRPIPDRKFLEAFKKKKMRFANQSHV